MMRELAIVFLVLLNAALAIPASRMVIDDVQVLMERSFVRHIEAENQRKTEQWLKEKKKYEQAGSDGAGD